MALDKLGGNSFSTGAIANSLGYTPANKAGDTFTGNVNISGGTLQVQYGSTANNNLVLNLDQDDTWLEQRKPDATIVGRMGFNGYSTNTALYTDLDVYTRTVGDTGLVRRMYINGSTSATPNVDFVNVNMVTRGGYRMWDAGYAPGAVLQVVNAFKTDPWSTNATGDTAITGLSVSITPHSSSSRFLIMYHINYDSTRGNSGGGFRIYRNGSHWTSGSGGAAGNRYTVTGDFGANANADQSGMCRSYCVVDNPATTSTLTYALYTYQGDSTFSTYINRARADADQGDDPRMTSSIVVMELAG